MTVSAADPGWLDRSAIAIGYGTNGFGDHRLDDAIDVLARQGYRALALTVGFPHLDPFADDALDRARRLAERLASLRMRVVVETGTRYLLDPIAKHRPTLVDRDATARIEYLRRAIDIAAVLSADCVSLWSGVLPPDVTPDEGWQLLSRHLVPVLDHARTAGVRLGFEPEPGMLVETVDDVLRLRALLDEPADLGITVDLGHCVVVEPGGIAAALRKAGSLLVNVQVDDMRPTAHEHLEFGDGQVDLPLALRTLIEIGYGGVAAVELPRHSHDAPGVAQRSIAAWRRAAAEVTRSATGVTWWGAALAALGAEPEAIGRLFTEAGRKVGRVAAEAFGPTPADLARVRLVEQYAQDRPDVTVAQTLQRLYRRGDADERRAVLRALAALPDPGPATVGQGLDLTSDALRTNDSGLVAAAMGGFAARHLDQHEWRHGVLKLLFMGVPITVVAELDVRADAELHRMADALLQERTAAGRSASEDIVSLAGSPAVTR